MPKNKRKKQAPIKEFWEKKLNLKYDAEIEYYRKLCGLMYDNELLSQNDKYDVKSEYLSYQEWKNHILNGVNNLDINKLKEYSRFLNQKCRDNATLFMVYQSILMPYIICIISVAASIVVSTAINSKQASAVMCVILFFIFIIAMFKQVFTTEEDITKNFYQDVKEIVDEKISQMETNKL